ncbi:MAG: 2-C-methyl-D-erythritol 4-phosphate cytidylyltransferase [Pseudomonadota bacterium]
MQHYSVIIAASGHGKRFESDTPKQYIRPLGKQSVLERCIQSWRAVPGIKRIIVVVAPEAQEQYVHPTGDDLLYVIGGAERAHSIQAGLEALAEESEEHWVLVHDAARPIFDVRDVQQLMETTKDHSVGGILVSPVKDTLRRINENNVCITVPRNEYCLAVCPQLFRRKYLQQALSQALTQNRVPSDEAQAIEWLNLPYLTVFARFYPNKITYPEDIKLLPWGDI